MMTALVIAKTNALKILARPANMCICIEKAVWYALKIAIEYLLYKYKHSVELIGVVDDVLW